MFEKQGWHFILLGVLLAGVALIARSDVLTGSLWGIETQTWLWIAVGVPVAHQVVVGLSWRAQLHYKLLTRWFGSNDFMVYKVIFTILFVGRPIALILLGIANRDTLLLNPILAYVLAGLLCIPFVYTMFSVLRYFGLDRAYGHDHFEPERYREKAFVKQGMFKYTANAMYKYAFLILWALALVCLSKAALLAAAFSHLYIWVHFYFTELPDMRQIYGTHTA